LRSNRTTLSPRLEASRATPRPLTPPPITTTSTSTSGRRGGLALTARAAPGAEEGETATSPAIPRAAPAWPGGHPVATIRRGPSGRSSGVCHEYRASRPSPSPGAAGSPSATRAELHATSVELHRRRREPRSGAPLFRASSDLREVRLA